MPVSWCKRIYLSGVVALVTALCVDLKIDKFDLLTNFERSVACGKGLAIRLSGEASARFMGNTLYMARCTENEVRVRVGGIII